MVFCGTRKLLAFLMYSTYKQVLVGLTDSIKKPVPPVKRDGTSISNRMKSGERAKGHQSIETLIRSDKSANDNDQCNRKEKEKTRGLR